jgi:hypothetical protein
MWKFKKIRENFDLKYFLMQFQGLGYLKKFNFNP